MGAPDDSLRRRFDRLRPDRDAALRDWGERDASHFDRPMSTYRTSEDEHPHADRIEKVAAYMAERIGRGFVAHDRREREAAIEAFAAVDRLQFAHLDESAAREAAVGFVDALWAKDDVEDACRVDGDIDPDRLADADWSAVEAEFAKRADAAGIDPSYARLNTEGWIEHKAGGDYWTPMMHAQMLELRAAMQDPTYPDKPRNGQSGFGPEPARYALGIELHDTRRFEEGCEAMVPYFERVLEAHDDDRIDSITVPAATD